MRGLYNGFSDCQGHRPLHNSTDSCCSLSLSLFLALRFTRVHEDRRSILYTFQVEKDSYAIVRFLYFKLVGFILNRFHLHGNCHNERRSVFYLKQTESNHQSQSSIYHKCINVLNKKSHASFFNIKHDYSGLRIILMVF